MTPACSVGRLLAIPVIGGSHIRSRRGHFRGSSTDHAAVERDALWQSLVEGNRQRVAIRIGDIVLEIDVDGNAHDPGLRRNPAPHRRPAIGRCIAIDRCIAIGPCIATVAAILCSGLLPAQVSEQEFRGETTVNVVDVPVRVFDPDTGRPVTGLTAADFKVVEQGKKQKISHFAEIRGPGFDVEAVGAVAEAGPAQVETRPVEMIYFFDLYLGMPRDRSEAVEAVQKGADK